MTSPAIHILSELDQKLITKMATIICEQQREYFVSHTKRDKSMEFYKMNLNGFGAELAFCRLAKVEFDESVIENENHFKKPDCCLPDGRTVDVKTTVYSSGKLGVRMGKEKALVNIYALMTGEFPKFSFKGWASYEKIIDPKNILDLGWGKGYYLPQSELNKELNV